MEYLNSSNTVTDVLAPAKSRKVWVARNGNKVPLRISDWQNASVSNPADWSTFQEVVNAIDGKNNYGIGLVLTPPLVGIDLDTYKTSDPRIIAIHQWIHDELFANTYSELSPNGGVHILCSGSFTTTRRDLKRIFVELKDDNHYLTYSGHTLHNLPCIECPQALEQLSQWIDNYFPAPSCESTSTVDEPETQTDAEIYAAAASARNGELFKELWLGHWEDRYPSQSEADQALANIIAFYTDSRQQTARLFLSSELGKRKKAQRRDYLYSPKYGLVTLAFDQKLPLPELTDLGEKFKQLAAAANNGTHFEHKASLIQATPQSVTTPHHITEPPLLVEPAVSDWKPPGLLGDIADFIYNAAHHPNEHVALAAAIAFLAGLTGRAFNTPTSTGLNQYIVLLGGSGIGKEGGPRGISRLCAALRTVAKDALYGYMGPAEIASPQGLMRHLVDRPSMCSCLGEIGIWLQKLNSPQARTNEAQLKKLLLDLYHKSGQGDVLNGAIYADKNNNIAPVNAPSFTFLGDSMPNHFYKNIDETTIHEGFISRLTVISCPDVCPTYNPDAGDHKPSGALLTKLEGLVPRVCFINQTVSTIVKVDETPEARAFQLEYKQFCQKKEWNDRSNPINQIWNRAHIRLLRLGSLIAVGKFHEHPVIELPHYLWAQKLIEDGITTVTQQFESGNVGNTTLEFKQQQEVANFLRNYTHTKWDQQMQDSYRITKIMHESKGIPLSYLQQRLKNMAVFTKDHDPGKALKRVIEHFITVEALAEWEAGPVEGNTRRTAKAYRILDESKLM